VAEAGVRADYDHLKHTAAAALSEAKVTGRNRCLVQMLPLSFLTATAYSA
jgi:hypothetical protein